MKGLFGLILFSFVSVALGAQQWTLIGATKGEDNSRMVIYVDWSTATHKGPDVSVLGKVEAYPYDSKVHIFLSPIEQEGVIGMRCGFSRSYVWQPVDIDRRTGHIYPKGPYTKTDMNRFDSPQAVIYKHLCSQS
jgi:hypothetical protein